MRRSLMSLARHVLQLVAFEACAEAAFIVSNRSARTHAACPGRSTLGADEGRYAVERELAAEGCGSSRDAVPAGHHRLPHMTDGVAGRSTVAAEVTASLDAAHWFGSVDGHPGKRQPAQQPRSSLHRGDFHVRARCPATRKNAAITPPITACSGHPSTRPSTKGRTPSIMARKKKVATSPQRVNAAPRRPPRHTATGRDESTRHATRPRSATAASWPRLLLERSRQVSATCSVAATCSWRSPHPSPRSVSAFHRASDRRIRRRDPLASGLAGQEVAVASDWSTGMDHQSLRSVIMRKLDDGRVTAASTPQRS